MATHESILTFNPDDPRWTAYVLGELDASVRAELDAALEASSDARRFVAELRQVAGLVGASLQAEPVARVGTQLTAPIAPRQLVERAKPAEPMISKRRQRIYQAAVALAAVAFLAALLLPALQSARESGLRSKVVNPQDNGLTVYDPAIAEIESVASDSFDQNGTPFPADQPIVYPPGTTWQDIQQRRQKFRGSVNLRPLGKVHTEPQLRESYAGTSSQDDLETTAHPVADLVLPLNLKPTITVSGGTVATDGTAATPAPGTITHNSSSPSRGSTLSLSGLGGRTYRLKSAPYSFDGAGKEWKDAATKAPGFVPQEEREVLLWRNSFDLAELPKEQGLALVKESLADGLAGVTREFDNVVDNPFLPARDNPLSTFSVDVDTASYSIVRRFIAQDHRLPPKSAVRIEELINYFHYDYPQPTGEAPVATTAEVVSCPWNAEHQLVRVAVKAREVPPKKRPPTNLVFLVDVSGSMNQPNKLPLVKQAMKLLVGQLTENDRVAIVVYAGASGLVLPSVTGDQRAKIDEALDRLEAGGSTNGGEGIQLAYELALRNFVRGGANRVILATDGDFNVGITDRAALIKLIEEQAKSGVFLTALGFGMDNLKDGTLEQLADKGNGHYAFIDTFEEARKVFVDEINGTLVTVAKDVKIQIEFNPAAVGSYRLIGYENRALKAEDFNNDKKDAGDMGSGHTVTALYEIAPVGAPTGAAPVDPLKYQSPPIKLTLPDAATSDELMTLKLRYKEPDAQTSKLMEVAVKRSNLEIAQASADFKFAAAVASFGMTLRDSPYKGRATIDSAIKLAEAGQGTDASGYRAQFVELLKQAKSHLPAVKAE